MTANNPGSDVTAQSAVEVADSQSSAQKGRGGLLFSGYSVQCHTITYTPTIRNVNNTPLSAKNRALVCESHCSHQAKQS